MRTSDYVVIGFVLAFCLFIAFIVWLQFTLSRRDCRVTATKMELLWDHSGASGCMVQVDHKWVPLSAVRRELP